MIRKFENKKITWTLIVPVLAVWMMIVIPECAVGQDATSYRSPEVQFLEEKYAIDFDGSVSNGEFILALAKVLNLDCTEHSDWLNGNTPSSQYSRAADVLHKKGILTEHKPDGQLMSIDAVVLTVRASGLTEVAGTYRQPKTAAALGKLGLAGSKLQPLVANELAVAIDSGLLPPSMYKEIRLKQAVTPELADVLLSRVLAFHGDYAPSNYLGYITDEDIYGKVYAGWKQAKLIKNEKLLEAANRGVEQGLITGYNLRDKDNAPRFDERRTIRYGHSSITHALQLIALLKSEGLNAKVQFEPKTSAYIYLREWGEPVTTPDFTVCRLDNGTYVAFAKEYDLSFEFPTIEQKQAFQTIIFKYAKKDRENQQGLLRDAWWQPLYTSVTPINGYRTIIDHVITDTHYEIHTFSLEEKSPAVIAGLREISPEIQIAAQPVWVDNPFYQYLLGGYK